MMPSYRVIAKGFFGGMMYAPDGKRRVVHTDKPLKPVPSWLEPMKAESAAATKKRVAAEKRAGKADAEKAAQDKTDIDNASFIGGGESGGGESGGVETL